MTMSNYDQFMKHWKNHSKDKGYQQCSGYFGDGVSRQRSEEEMKRLERDSFRRISERASSLVFPIYITQCGCFWTICDDRNLFGTKISSAEELEQFGKDCVCQ